MNSTTTITLDTSFKKDVFEGLTSFPKYLLSKYIYDETGDKLFQDIMAMPEYYLTNCEFEILSIHTESIAQLFKGDEQPFDLIELGAGDGKKTKVLLKHLSKEEFDFTYKPVDISKHAIEDLTSSLSKELPTIKVDAEIGTYFEVLNRLKQDHSRKKILMFLGSNIGNLRHPVAIDFLSKLRNSMGPNDLLFMGFDQKKNPEIILNAYNDPAGITEAFNKNQFHRINKELGGNFNPAKFKHWEVYNPESGTAESYLISLEDQVVTIDELDLSVNFEAWETIHMEISQKYDDKTVEWLAKESKLAIETSFTDSKEYYKNYVFSRKE